MATYFTTVPSSLSGDVYSTTFQHALLNTYEYISWDLGDGTFVYNQKEVSHVYNHPGTYQVSVTAGNYNQPPLIDSTPVYTDLVCRDGLVFTQIPSEFGTVGRETLTPFVLSLTSSRIDESISVCLYSFNSRSVPYFAVPDKWSFLVPKWRFIDAETKVPFGDSVVVNTVPLYKNSTVIGVSGQLSFYYIDDSSTGLGTDNESPILLNATLSTENFAYPPESQYYKHKSYSNPKNTKATLVWHVNDTPVTNYKITENYLNDIYPIKWKDVPIPVMVTCRFTPPNPDQEQSDVIGYPRTNEIGLQNPINLTLIGDGFSIPTSYYQVDSPLYFKATDENGIPCPGYIFTTITPLTTFPYNVRVALSSTTQSPELPEEGSFSFPYGYPIYAQTFVNNPFRSNINVISFYNYNFSPYESQTFDTYIVSVPALSVINTTGFYEITGTSNMYGIAFNPLIDRMYALDGDQDTIQYFDPPYALTFRKTLSSITGIFPSVPSYLSIDGNNDVWISMYNSYKLLKFDKNLNLILSATPTVTVAFDAEVEGSPIVASTTVETDQDNNIWSCCAHPVSSMLIKFDSQGNQLLIASQLSLSSVPVSLAINPNKDVWVACYNSNSVELYSSSAGQLLSSISTGFIHPSYIALDREANVWFTHGYNFLSMYDVRTYQLSTWKFENELSTVSVANRPYTSQELNEALYENEIWNGLGVDVYNRVWVIDGRTNTVGVFKNINPTNIYTTSITPTVPLSTARSAQVTSDWTGNRWYQKYAFFDEDIANTSTPFRVFDINDYQIAKVNETFDCGKYMKSLALPEHLSNNTEFFDSFLPAIVGDGSLPDESPGRVSYERIANFVQTHSDLETSEIDQLVSMADQLSYNTKTFGKDFPAAVMRLLNLFSIPKQRLRGNIAYSTDFQNNIKELITETSLISANETIIAKDRRYGTYQSIFVSPIGPLTSYPLSMIELPQMRSPIFDNYHFFRYSEDAIGYKDNVIDWDSKYTTINYNLSTRDEWYGDEGLVDIMFNNLLTKQLFLE